MNNIKSSIALAVIVATGVGLYFFSINKNIPPQTPGEVVNAFYTKYQACLKNPPADSKNQVSIYCQNQKELVSADFNKNIEIGGIAQLGADPIGCAQNPPQNFLASDANIATDGKSAMVVVKEFFDGPRLDIRVNLKNIDNQWKIDNILCPIPNPAPLSQKETVITARIGEKISALGVAITPQEVLEDSRCPKNVQCIQAGTVRLKTMLEGGMGAAPQIFVIGKPITTETEEVILLDVGPLRNAGASINPSEYQFVFQIKKRLP